MSALCQKQTSARLFDHLVGPNEQRRWHSEAERLGRLEVDYHEHLGRKLDGQVAGSSAVQDLVYESGGAPPAPLQIHTITGEPAGDNMRAVSVDRRQPLLQCQRSDLPAVAERRGRLQ